MNRNSLNITYFTQILFFAEKKQNNYPDNYPVCYLINVTIPFFAMLSKPEYLFGTLYVI